MVWRAICKKKEERPKLQSYRNWDELSPIPISFPMDGSIGITGDWRTFRPMINEEKCTNCGICWMYCPEGVIQKNGNGSFEIDYRYCKGCGICARECPTKNIEMKRESENHHDEPNKIDI